MKKMEQGSTDGNAKKTTNNKSNSQLIEQKIIEGTPFNINKVNDKWFLALGKYRLTELLETEEEAREEAKDASWFRIMQVIQIVINEDKKKSDKEPEIENQIKLNLNK